jgi:putative flippase GtrA
VIELIRNLFRLKLVRYAFSGTSALITEEVALFLCHGLLGWPLWLATTIAYGAAFALNFTLNRVFTFAEDGAREGAVQGQTVRFAILVGVNYFVTQGAMYLLTNAGINYLIAKPLATLIIMIYNFYLYKVWVFKAPAPAAEAPAAGQAEAGKAAKAEQPDPASAEDRIRA